jgi:hypothetical protein
VDGKGIPMQYLQIDSYWYYKGKNGGVTNWSATPEAFPGGLAALSEETGTRNRHLFGAVINMAIILPRQARDKNTGKLREKRSVLCIRVEVCRA